MALCKPLQPLVTSPTMSLRRIALRDFVIVQSLDLDLSSGFSVLTGETGAGKSILIDALQLALGSRADAGVVREGAQRCEVAAEFDSPAALVPWLEEQGFTADEALLLRRTVDTEGRSRAWINGSAATMAQLKALADGLVDIHGQHAWQSLTRADAVRTLLDGYAGVDLTPLQRAWTDWRDARLVPTSEGRFDLNDYVDYLIEFLEVLGPDSHVVAVCQPCVQVLAAGAACGPRSRQVNRAPPMLLWPARRHPRSPTARRPTSRCPYPPSPGRSRRRPRWR